MKKENNVWILRVNSESGDDYGCWVFNPNKPDQETIESILSMLGEEREYLHYDIIQADLYTN